MLDNKYNPNQPEVLRVEAAAAAEAVAALFFTSLSWSEEEHPILFR